MSDARRKVMAVIGNGGAIPEVVAAQARALGRLAVDAGFRIVTGGLGGVMAAASEGARTSSAYTEGSVVGVIPSYDRTSANPWVDVVIPTGMQLARNVLVVAMADVVVVVGGGAGTLSEMAMAWQLGRPILALTEPEGWGQELAGRTLDPRCEEPVHRAERPEDAVATALSLAQRVSESGDIGGGWKKARP